MPRVLVENTAETVSTIMLKDAKLQEFSCQLHVGKSIGSLKRLK